MILGGGPNRIGQGIEFDYCCCHAAFRAWPRTGERAVGRRLEVIMVNCNPETVSTDTRHLRPALFRAADGRGCARVVRREQARGELIGVIVQLGGQNAAETGGRAAGGGVRSMALRPIASTRRIPRAVRGAGRATGLKQPENGIAREPDEAIRVASGSAIQCFCVRLRARRAGDGGRPKVPQQLDHYIATAVEV